MNYTSAKSKETVAASGKYLPEEIISNQKTKQEFFSHIYQDMRNYLLNSLNSRVRPEHSEDILGETILLAYAKIGNFRGEGELKTWVYRIMLNQVHLFYRRKFKENKVSINDLNQSLLYDSRENAEDILLRLENENFIKNTIQNLPEKYRMPLHLFEFEGYSTRKIARHLDLVESTVRTRIYRGKKMIIEELERQKNQL
jgi:RNA polymerase sigma factor (sigma-70 family)